MGIFRFIQRPQIACIFRLWRLSGMCAVIPPQISGFLLWPKEETIFVILREMLSVVISECIWMLLDDQQEQKQQEKQMLNIKESKRVRSTATN